MSLYKFRTIGKGISIYESAAGEESSRSDGFPSQPTEDQPALIIICTWLGGATSKRIERYTHGYHRIWPKANILLLRTEPVEYAFCGARALSRKLLPALAEIRRLVEANSRSHMSFQASSPSTTSANRRGILMHVFSNGGANIATQLVTAINSTLSLVGERSPLELRQIVFDSCPGDPGTNAMYRAASESLPRSHPLRPLGCAILYLVVAGIAGLEVVGIRKKLGKTMRDQFNDPGVFDKAAWRLYLTSNADVMMDTVDVQAHRDQALASGLRADTIVFEKAGHCALVLENEAVYWGAIARCWEQRASQNAAPFTDDDGSTGHEHFGRSKSIQDISNQQFRSRL